MRVAPLRKLVFGDEAAPLLTSADAVQDFLTGPVAARDIRGLHKLTRYKAARLQFPGLSIFCSSSDPFEMSCAYQPDTVPLFVPLSGIGSLVYRGRRQPWSANDNLALGTCESWHGYSFDTPRTLLFLVLEQERLAQTMRSMRGGHFGLEDVVMPGRPRVACMTPEQANLRSLLVSTLALSDLPGNDADYLRRIGYDDVIHRIVADLYASLLGRGEPAAEPPRIKRSLRALDLVCDHIVSNAGPPLTLTEMERLTGMTSRSLNNAFRERFDVSPQQWQRNHRLDQARSTILEAAGAPSVKALARQFGFISPYSFSAFYRQRFGELPSETLRRRRQAPALQGGTQT